MRRRDLIASLCALGALPACAPRQIALAEREGGIGGTGAPLVGAAGVVTGFGSIHLNGLRALTDQARIWIDGREAAATALAIGQQVELFGAPGPDGTIRATGIEIVHAVVGPARAISADGRAFEVLGAPVLLDAGVAPPRAGMRVAVSGLPRDGALIASRVAPAAPDQPDRALSRAPKTSLFQRLGEPLRDLSVEGYLRADAASPAGYRIDGFAPEVEAGSQLATLAGERALFIGALEGGAFRVRHGLALPEGAVARRRLLAAVEDGFAPAGAISTQ